MNQNEEKYILYDKPTIVSHNALKMELSNFVQSILQDEEPAVTGVDGLSALKIAMQIQSQIKKENSNYSLSIEKEKAPSFPFVFK